MEYDSEDKDHGCTPPELRAIAESASTALLPEKSKSVYELEYTKYTTWRQSHEATATSQNVLLAYFKILLEKYKSTTLWSTHYKLKSIISIKEKINISIYADLNAFLKRQSRDDSEKKKSYVLETEDVKNFLANAPDDKHLLSKVRK